MKFISSTSTPDYNTGLRQILDAHTGQGSLRIAVAFWGLQSNAVLNAVLGSMDAADCEFVCNLESGATNPDAIEALRTRGIRVRSNPRLHAKVIIAAPLCILGSANLSANGLGFEGLAGDESFPAFWEEAGLLTDDPVFVAEATQWFAALWIRDSPHDSTYVVEDEHIAQARALRKRQKPFLPDATENQEKVIEWLKSRLDCGQVSITLWHAQIHQPSEAALRQNIEDSARFGLPDLSFYEGDWHDIQSDLIIDLEVGKTTHYSFWTPAHGNFPDFSVKLQRVESARLADYPPAFRNSLEKALRSLMPTPARLAKILKTQGPALITHSTQLAEFLGLAPAQAATGLTLQAIKSMLREEASAGGLIYIKNGPEGYPGNFTVNGSQAVSGVWFRALQKKPLKWLLVYHRLGPDLADVWMAVPDGVSGAPGAYQIGMKNVQGPVRVDASFRTLTGKQPPENPIYAQ